MWTECWIRNALVAPPLSSFPSISMGRLFVPDAVVNFRAGLYSFHVIITRGLAADWLQCQSISLVIFTSLGGVYCRIRCH